MKFIASFFKLIFKIRFFKKYFFVINRRIFKSFGLFRGQTAVCSYAGELMMKVNLDEWIQQHVYFLGVWDEPGINFLRNSLKEGDVFIDIGANIGTYTLVASKSVGHTGRVYAFEPVKAIFRRLIENIEMNDLQNIFPIRKAVYNDEGIVDIFVSGNDNLGMSGIFHHDNESGTIEKAEAVNMDAFVEQEGLSRISLIKVDIEGAEFYALQGMVEVLKRFKPLVLLELSEEVLSHTPFSSTLIIQFLEKLDYSPRAIDRGGNLMEFGHSDYYNNYVFIPS